MAPTLMDLVKRLQTFTVPRAIFSSACMYVCMYVCMYTYMHACMHACTYV